MTDTNSGEKSSRDIPSRYRIRVYGHLNSGWSSRLGEMVITRAFSSQQQPITILVGPLMDQSALSGILNTLHDMNLKVISVENLDDDQSYSVDQSIPKRLVNTNDNNLEE